MSLQIGSALRDGASKVASKTGLVLLVSYVALTATLLPISNTMIARIYETAGLSEVAGQLPLVLGLPLSVAVGGYVVGILLGSYLSLVAIRTFVTGDGDSFPAGTFTRNVPLALVNLIVGGFIYFVLMAIGFVFLFIPGLLVYVAFLFMLPYIGVEDRNFVDALRGSYGLAKGNFLMLIVLAVVIFGLSFFVGFVGGFVSALLLPPAIGQLSLVFVQSPVSLYMLAVIAAAFEQLRDGEGDTAGASSSAETPSTPA